MGPRVRGADGEPSATAIVSEIDLKLSAILEIDLRL
jgi:hypothetical protein